MSLCASVYMCFVVTCWERADLLALVCGVYYEFVTFPLVSGSGVVLDCIDSRNIEAHIESTFHFSVSIDVFNHFNVKKIKIILF